MTKSPSVKNPFIYAVLSAVFFGISPPLAKLLLTSIKPVLLAGLLYLGAFLGLAIYLLFQKILAGNTITRFEPLRKGDYRWLAGAIIAGGVIAPICLMIGLTRISGLVTSLLLNLESVTTGLIAVFLFREHTGKRFWLVLFIMMIAGVLLAWDTSFDKLNLIGFLLLFAAMLAWGLDNNMTRQISLKNPIQIALYKSLIAGIVSIAIALLTERLIVFGWAIILALVLGACSYGLSLVLYIKSLSALGSARTGALFGLGPFIGAILSLMIFPSWPGWPVIAATFFMAIGVWLLINEKHRHLHHHQKQKHIHPHGHDDVHHDHPHLLTNAPANNHSHEHIHSELTHIHSHWPDFHHRHGHAK